MIIRNGTILALDENGGELQGDLRIDGSRIAAIGAGLDKFSGEEEIDATGCYVLPGFVQAHVHLCQTLFRHRADDLELLDWLRGHIWPYEAGHDERSMAASARLGLHEVLTGGTTTILDMGSVHHTDVLFREAETSGIRYVGGKCLMDLDEDGIVPKALIEDKAVALAETSDLISRWHGKHDGRLRYAVAPRFAVSCSEGLLREAGVLACRAGARIHTHASENQGEIDVIRKRTGRDNVDYLSDVGLLGSQTALAHCVHLSEHEMNLIWGSGTHVVHCPTSNLKLASGVAPIAKLLDQGINVALGADGAPCNNRLSMFREMHLAALLPRIAGGPRAMPARRVLEMATMGGARALGLEDEIGSLEVGKRADVIVIDPRAPELEGSGDPYATIVYGADAAHVRHVFVDGRLLVRDGRHSTLDRAGVLDDARAVWKRLQG